MSKGILCIIDFSESSRETLRCSVKLAKELKEHLTILYAYRLLQTTNGEAIEMKKKIETEAALQFETLEKDFLAGANINYDLKTEVGFVADRIKEHLKKNVIDFLIVGRKMITAQKQSFDELVSTIDSPLIIVP